MIYEVAGDITDFWRADNMIGITTNGFVKSNGRAVMGAGIAKTIRNEIPNFDLDFGNRLTARGNVPFIFREWHLFTFPVKHNWYEKADLDLIEQSSNFIAEKFDEGRPIHLPRPGCGNGKLNWTDVRPVLENSFKNHQLFVWDFA